MDYDYGNDRTMIIVMCLVLTKCQVHKGLSRETSSYGLIDRIGAQVAGLTPRSQASLGAKPQAEGEGVAEPGVD